MGENYQGLIIRGQKFLGVNLTRGLNIMGLKKLGVKNYRRLITRGVKNERGE